MDIFVEQIVKKAASGKDWAMRVIIGIAMGILSAASLFIFFFILPIPAAGLLLVAGIFWGAQLSVCGLHESYFWLLHH